MPNGQYNDPNFTLSPLSDARNRVLSHFPFDGNNSVYDFPPVGASDTTLLAELGPPPVGGGAVNQAPTAEAQAVTITSGTPVNITLTGLDPDLDLLSFVISGLPGNGGLAVGPLPSVTFTPNAGFTGVDAFDFMVNDGTVNSLPATVTITVDAVLVTVLDVVGQTQPAGTANLGTQGLTVGTVTTASSVTVPAGNVISQTPAAGASVAAGSTVALVVSTGPAPVTVPDVVGQAQATAQASLTAAGLLNTVTTTSSATVPAGNVISQTPAAGASVAAGSTVALVVSTGPAPAAGNVISEFVLYNTTTDAPVPGFVLDGLTPVSLAAHCSNSIAGCNIRAVVPAPEVDTQSVRLNLDGGPIPPGPFRNENSGPYFLSGDTAGDVFDLLIGQPYIGAGLTVGSHTVNATPFSGNNGGGAQGPAASVTFTVTP